MANDRKGRALYAQACIATARRNYLAQAEPYYAQVALDAQRAQQRADASAEDANAQLALLVDVRTRLGTADRAALQAGQQLRSLLGLSPVAPLPLGKLSSPVLPARGELQRATQRLAARRPDLLALQQGYRVQESQLRAAVLAQFPDISLGPPTHARDVSDVHTWGGALTLSLPLFDRGRGNLAIQRATREQLRVEYQARLDEAIGNTWQLWSELQQLDAQRRTLEAQLPQLHSSAEAARHAWQRGDLAAAGYLSFVSAYLDALDTRAELMQSLWNDSIALAAELGTQAQPPASDVGA